MTIRIATLLVAQLAVAAAVTPISAQTQTVRAVAGEEYGSPQGGKFLFGNNYRDLWTTPIEVKRLDLQEFAGGLRPVMRIGGNSTKGLALKGADGRDYTFRSVNKDLTGAVPVEFQDSVMVDIVQDQISGNVPGVEVIKPPLAQAVGLLAVDEARLVVLPDDPALGEFREDFAGVLGIFYEFPQPVSSTNPGFNGATEILSADEFREERQSSGGMSPDTGQFLRARLLDIFLNDYDRHRKQWRWARIPGESRLQPIPEDADMALTDYEGAAISAARLMGAPFVKFEEKYPLLRFITKNGWDFDRMLLTDIEKSEWVRIAQEMQGQLTDEVLEDALRRLPSEYFQLRGLELFNILKGRRDSLHELAEKFYHYMASQVDIHGSHSSEVARAQWLDGGDLRMTVAEQDESGEPGAPYYDRRFTPRETSEVRLYLHGGNDRVVTTGDREGGVKLRVIGGPGDDLVDQSAGGNVRFYDSEGDNRVEGGDASDTDTRPFTSPARPLPNDVEWTPNPDWGRLTMPVVSFGYAADPGLMLGGGFETIKRGFRKYPWASRHRLEGAWAFGASKPFVDYFGATRRANSNLQFELNARYSGIEQLRFFGLGNETEFDTLNDPMYNISNNQLEIFPAIALSNGRGTRFAIGPYMQHSDSGGTDPDTVLGANQPLGFGEFGYFGARTELDFSSRKPGNVFAPGIDLDSKAEYSLNAWDAQGAFGSGEAQVNGYFNTGRRFNWNLFGGGKKVWGDFPFFEAAYIDNRTTAGYNWNRFGGDASLYGGVDLDVIVGRARNFVPGDFGFSLFSHAGRVFLDGDGSSMWHPSYGAGMFYAPFKRSAKFGVKIGRNEDRTFILMQIRMSGLGF